MVCLKSSSHNNLILSILSRGVYSCGGALVKVGQFKIRNCWRVIKNGVLYCEIRMRRSRGLRMRCPYITEHVGLRNNELPVY
jgi:hypothetical protein